MADALAPVTASIRVKSRATLICDDYNKRIQNIYAKKIRIMIIVALLCCVMATKLFSLWCMIALIALLVVLLDMVRQINEVCNDPIFRRLCAKIGGIGRIYLDADFTHAKIELGNNIDIEDEALKLIIAVNSHEMQ